MLLGELTRWATDILTPMLAIVVDRFDLVSSSCRLSCLVFEAPVLPFFAPMLSWFLGVFLVLLGGCFLVLHLSLLAVPLTIE